MPRALTAACDGSFKLACTPDCTDRPSSIHKTGTRRMRSVVLRVSNWQVNQFRPRDGDGSRIASDLGGVWFQRRPAMIRKLAAGGYRLYSRKKNPKTGTRRNLGTFKSRAAAEKHERAVQFFKRR